MTKLFCGIDVAKYEHVASIYDPVNGELVLDSLHFDNNAKGFKCQPAFFIHSLANEKRASRHENAPTKIFSNCL